MAINDIRCIFAGQTTLSKVPNQITAIIVALPLLKFLCKFLYIPSKIWQKVYNYEEVLVEVITLLSSKMGRLTHWQ